MRPYLEGHFGNPSSGHWYGAQPRKAVAEARAWAARGRGNHIVTTRIEHPAVTEVCRWLAERGLDSGSVRHGEHRPIAEIALAAREKGAPMHTDAAQSAGKIAVDVEQLGVDLLSLAGHKLYAPKGIGASYVCRGVQLEKLVDGAGQESEIVGLGKACEIANRELARNAAHMRQMRDRLEAGLGARDAAIFDRTYEYARRYRPGSRCGSSCGSRLLERPRCAYDRVYSGYLLWRLRSCPRRRSPTC